MEKFILQRLPLPAFQCPSPCRSCPKANTSRTWISEQHRSLPSTDTREGGEGGPEEQQVGGLAFPGLGRGLALFRRRDGETLLPPILSQFSGFPKGLPGAYKSLWGKSPLRLPLASCQGPTLQPQYFSRLHSDTHKWRRSKPDQKKCGCG